MGGDLTEEQKLQRLAVKTFAKTVLTVSGRTPNALGLKYFASDSSTSIRSSDWNRLLTERESVPADVVDKVNRDFPGMKKWYPNSIFRALDPRMSDAELEKLKGELSYRCRRILLEHPEYREQSNVSTFTTFADLLPLLAIRSTDALAGAMILMRQSKLRRHAQNQHAAATGVRYLLHALKGHPVIGQIWDELVSHIDTHFSRVGTSVVISIDFYDTDFFGKARKELNSIPTMFSLTQDSEIEAWRPIYEGNLNPPFIAPEETDEEVIDAFDLLCACSAIPIYVDRLLGGPAHIGFGIEDMHDMRLLGLTGISDNAINFFATELGVTSSTLLEVAARFPVKEFPSFKGQKTDRVYIGTLEYTEVMQILELAERIALTQWSNSRMEELCAIRTEGLASYVENRNGLIGLACPSGRLTENCN